MAIVHDAVAKRIGPDLAELIEEVRVCGADWLKKKAAYERIDAERKILLAKLHEGYRAVLAGQGEKVTETRLDDLSRDDVRYRECIKRRYEIAIEEAELQTTYYAKRNALDVLIEVMRQERAEMRLVENS